MVKYFAKKWLLKKVNELMTTYKDDVSKCQQIVKIWLERITKILNLLTALNDRIEDNEISEQDVNDTVEDINKAIKEW